MVAALDRDNIRLKLNRSPEPVEGRLPGRRASTGSALRSNYEHYGATICRRAPNRWAKPRPLTANRGIS